ncbi:hypothetical protein [Spiroplasma endosymbiont of Tipula paludosa]|uniref:hypothetical protein n=1 Tax=Spiroplasma endosymbiont of Tipula paludosa TaxID=3066295 RepID=UPI0035C90BEC
MKSFAILFTCTYKYNSALISILDLVHNYNILCRLNYKIHFYLCIYLTFVFHLKNNYQNSR